MTRTATAASTTIQVGRLALIEAATTERPYGPGIRVIKPLRRMLIGLIDEARDVAPTTYWADEPAFSKATEHLVAAASDLIAEAMRRADKAARGAGQDPAEAVRKTRAAFDCVTAICASQYNQEGQ